MIRPGIPTGVVDHDVEIPNGVDVAKFADDHAGFAAEFSINALASSSADTV